MSTLVVVHSFLYATTEIPSILISNFDITSDLYDIYHSRHLDPDAGPRALQNMVQWDIRFYFARRGSENMYNMTKRTFTIKMDEKTGCSML